MRKTAVTKTSRAVRLIGWCTWLYLAAAIAACLALYAGGDRWWWAAPLVYGPRWLLLLPLLPLAAVTPTVCGLSSRRLVPLAATGALVLFVFCGVCWPWRALLHSKPAGFSLRILSCNLNAMPSGFERLERLLETARPDVMVLPECSDEFLAHLKASGRWHCQRKRSMCVASRWPIRRADWLVDDGRLGYWGDFAVRCELAAPKGIVSIIGVHLETPREALEALIDRRWRARTAVEQDMARRARISALARRLVDRSPASTIVAGDFNLPIESAIYRRDWSPLENAFSSAGLGLGYTKRSRWFGVRIDHVLAGRPWQVERCWVGPDVGSDHRPLLAELTAAAT